MVPKSVIERLNRADSSADGGVQDGRCQHVDKLARALGVPAPPAGRYLDMLTEVRPRRRLSCRAARTLLLPAQLRVLRCPPS